MTKYIPCVHPHQFPTAKLRIIPRLALSQFTPILSQFTIPKKQNSEGGPAGWLGCSHYSLFYRVSNLKGPENILFSRFQNPLGLATLFSPCFDFETASRHSFRPLSKSFGPRDTLFSHFQNHLGLARVFLSGFILID